MDGLTGVGPLVSFEVRTLGVDLLAAGELALVDATAFRNAAATATGSGGSRCRRGRQSKGGQLGRIDQGRVVVVVVVVVVGRTLGVTDAVTPTGR